MKILVWASEVGFYYALKFCLEDNIVYYFRDIWEAFPSITNWAIGQGIENLIAISDPGDILDKVDFIFFTDVGRGKTIDYLKKRGYKVFGAPSKAEIFELKKRNFYDFIKANGLPVAKTYVITGTSNVKRFFKENKGEFYLKIDMPFRGSMPTTLIHDYDEARTIIDTLESQILPLKEKVDFLIQEKISGVHAGFDGFVFSGKFYELIGFGPEVNSITVNKWVPYDETIFYKAIKVFERYFKEINYTGNFSLEGIYDGKDLYLIDPTCRPPYPSSACLCQSIENFTEFLYNGYFDVKNTKLIYRTKYAGCFLILSEHSDVLLNLHLKKGVKFWPIKLFISNNEFYFPPEEEKNEPIGVVVGEGDSVDEVFMDAKKQLKKISCFGMSAVYNYDDYKTLLKKYKELGIIF